MLYIDYNGSALLSAEGQPCMDKIHRNSTEAGRGEKSLWLDFEFLKAFVTKRMSTPQKTGELWWSQQTAWV